MASSNPSTPVVKAFSVDRDGAIRCVQIARMASGAHPTLRAGHWLLVEVDVGPVDWSPEERRTADEWARRSYLQGSTAAPPPHVQQYFDRFDELLARPETKAILARGFRR
jgi:hypothetical protein